MINKNHLIFSIIPLIIFVGGLSYASSGAGEIENAEQRIERAQEFIDKVARDAISFISDEDLSKEEKIKEFEKLLSANFDMETIARFSLGRYWRQASEQQLEEYTALFKKMVLQVYSKRFNEYNGQTLRVNGSQATGKRDVIVNSFIDNGDNSKILIQWRVRQTEDGFKIVDIIVEGVSMVITQRSDFASVMQRGGGNVDVLINRLRERTRETP